METTRDERDVRRAWELSAAALVLLAVGTAHALVGEPLPPRPASAGGGPRSPKPVEVLKCRGDCAVGGVECAAACVRDTLVGRADCLDECRAAVARCYRGCGTYPGDAHPEPPK